MTRPLPEGRYAASRSEPTDHRKAWIATAVVVIAGLVVAFYAYQRFGVSELDAEAKAYEIIDDSRIDVTVSLTRAEPDRDVVCIVRARSKDGSETGRREMLIPATGDPTVLVTAPVYTSHPPGMGDLYGCSYDIPEYLVAPPAAG
ncbi:DUF4307 domain-containing protein [Rhodococcus rhodnii]|uniref:DUF4307 domain-containing protein n=2 Tax=Rhodococcus rhodnii TaxID=38312 RepID=R7WJZ3_9NOCA|nr:DUF4307 domain-containing protein [Rhodococcus rhodnii]EOM75605.1 hypothetical protein Rrhod_3065 [Rhodococcus rhodnii LMG 5362]TXG91875.1 DUF4307 domain-containing protein [Rhodococcus rhodnii]